MLHTGLRRFAAASLAMSCALAIPATTLAASPSPAPMSPAATAAAVKGIETECNAIQSAIQALKPVHLALVRSNWRVLSDADYTVAQRTHASVTFVDAWKRGTGYAWIAAHRFDANGNQHATQLCFRQSDGTLERARQAVTVPALNAASARQAYFASNGTIIQKSALFEVNDPALAKKIKALPFYNSLP
jgi:hypothetical protein